MRARVACAILGGVLLACSGSRAPEPEVVSRTEAPEAPTAELRMERDLSRGVASPQLSRAMKLTSGAYRSYEYSTVDRSSLPFNTEAYDKIDESGFRSVSDAPLSTFSIDVDTASYANVRRFLVGGQLPPPDAVRIEELVNYFPYRYREPSGETPFSVDAAVVDCPWEPEHRLVRIGLRALEIPPAERPPANLVFLVDVSGSMRTPQKLPLVKSALRLLAQQLGRDDRVSLVVYAGAAGVVLPPTGDAGEIVRALERLEAGGSTNGGQGIELAYRIATENPPPRGGISRVVLATDGDFNVGVTNQGELIRLIERNAKKGVSLTVLGFGMGNYKDSALEKLADRGDGNYAYIDTLHEARKVLVEQIGGTLITVAKDVKIQVEFNPLAVSHYRLIGYENRALRPEDFADDRKDAGEIGAGHTVTALYEIIPVGTGPDDSPEGALRYQQPRDLTETAEGGELLHVKIRYKAPEGGASHLLSFPVAGASRPIEQASEDLRFASAVAAFGMLLRGSEHSGSISFEDVVALADGARGDDPSGYRAEFIRLAELARDLTGS